MSVKENKYIKEWKNYIEKAENALTENNDEQYSILMEKANESYEKYKEEMTRVYECKNFGMSKYIFEDALPNLFKTNKRAVKEFMKTIKEDKNLLSQYMFYQSLDMCNDKERTEDYLSEAISLARERIDTKTLNESNNKLAAIISKYEIKPSEVIPNDKLLMYENCDYLLKHDVRLHNLSEHRFRSNALANYIKNTITENLDSKITVNSIESFNDKYSKILSNEEKKFVKQIVESTQNNDTVKQEALFNSLKNECIVTIDRLLENASEDDKIGLESIKEQLENKSFIQETLVKDIAKFLEIKDVLNS